MSSSPCPIGPFFVFRPDTCVALFWAAEVGGALTRRGYPFRLSPRIHTSPTFNCPHTSPPIFAFSKKPILINTLVRWRDLNPSILREEFLQIFANLCHGVVQVRGTDPAHFFENEGIRTQTKKVCQELSARVVAYALLRRLPPGA